MTVDNFVAIAVSGGESFDSNESDFDGEYDLVVLHERSDNMREMRLKGAH